MTDKLTVRLVIAFLGLGFILCLLGGFVLASQRVEVPEFLVGLGGTALGALGSLLARVGDGDPQNVYVTNDDEERIPVDPS